MFPSRGRRFFFSPHRSGPLWGPLSVQWASGVLFSVIKRPGREGLSSAEVKNASSYRDEEALDLLFVPLIFLSYSTVSTKLSE